MKADVHGMKALINVDCFIKVIYKEEIYKCVKISIFNYLHIDDYAI